MEKITHILNNKFGFTELRDFQKKVINQALLKKDILVISPTSSGKSLCFQLPALINDGISVVISPLRSLIYDQVSKLKEKNINAHYLSSDITKDNKIALFNKLDINTLNEPLLLYTTPETIINNSEFIDKLNSFYEKNKLNYIIIDEAHCVSTWGHDFRPNYLKLKYIRNEFPNTPIMALTASATEKVKMDITQILNMKKYETIQKSFLRDNLVIKIRDKNKNTFLKIEESLKSHYKNKSGIIYCSSRNKCEELYEKLNSCGISAYFYHAGLTKKLREEIQKKWIDNKINVIIATIAFGMGIDKPDVRFVIHYNMPHSLENYYQEIGRAGRDGKVSECVLYYNLQDKVIYQKMIEKEKSPSPKKNEYNKNRLNKLKEMCLYLENIIDCRHALISNHFGEKLTPLTGYCNIYCDNCYQNKNNIINKDMTQLSIDIVNIILKLKNDASKSKIKQILKGLSYVKRYNNLNEFGRGKMYSDDVVNRVLLYLINNKFLKEKIIKNGAGFFNDKLLVYEKSKDLLNKKLTIEIPFQKIKKIQEFFVITRKKK